MQTAPPAELERMLAAEVLTQSPRFFGSPLSRFYSALRAGDLGDEGVRAHARADAHHASAFDEQLRQRHNAVVHKIHMLKRTWKPTQHRASKGSAKGDQPTKESGGKRSKSGGGGAQRQVSVPQIPTSAGMPLDAASAAAALHAGASVAQASLPSADGPDDDASMQSPGELQPSKRARVSTPGSGASDGATSPTDMSVDEANGGGGGTPSELRFFELVRDAIHSVPQALAPAEYVRKQIAIQAQAAGLVSKLPRGAVLAQYIRSVLIFMGTPADGHAARTTRVDAEGSEPHPDALVAFDQSMQSYRWIGTPATSTNAALARLEQIHYEVFLAQQGGVVGACGQRGLHAAPTSHKSVLTLPPGSAEQLAKFRDEETRRFEQAPPDQMFTYTLRDGSTASVAPLGKKPGGKAREHFLLLPERPAAVTVLSLVRDAAARMPGAEGSRTDVCELLKESAFVIVGVNDAQISTVASGALDRLQSELDPCVRYDTERKLWVYLHGQRTAEDFVAAAAAAAASKAAQPASKAAQ